MRSVMKRRITALMIGTALVASGASTHAWSVTPLAVADSGLGSGDAERGRALYHGKGVCASCHGVDGDPARRPSMNKDTAAVIARLKPPPSDLRVPDQLRLLSEQQRFKAIRKGHPGTAMLPDPTLTDQEITDLLAYLARLRSEGSAKSK